MLYHLVSCSIQNKMKVVGFMEYVLKTSDLTKVYSGKAAVNKVNLEIKKGDIYGFVGKNGAGKTTTMKMIAGLDNPSSGKIELFGEASLDLSRKKIGTVIEYPALYPYMTAKQNVEAQRIFLGIKDKSVTNSILETVGLSDTGNKKAKEFSLGMKQRLGIALALVGDPEFLLLDEPTNGLDPMGIKEMRDLILKLNKERGITIMVSSHIIGELVRTATCYGVISEGEIVDQFHSDRLKDIIKKRIRLRVNDPERALDIIKNQLGIKTSRLENRDIFIDEKVESAGEINKALVESDIIIENMATETGDYEDYFIKLMEGKNNG